MTNYLLLTGDWGDVITLLDRDRLVIPLADTGDTNHYEGETNGNYQWYKKNRVWGLVGAGLVSSCIHYTIGIGDCINVIYNNFQYPTFQF